MGSITLSHLICGRNHSDVAIFMTYAPMLPSLLLFQDLKARKLTAMMITQIIPLMIFFDDENINRSDQEIYEKVNFILTNLQCSQEHCNHLEEATRNQAVSQLWYNHRKGRVAGTKAHDVLVRRQTTKWQI